MLTRRRVFGLLGSVPLAAWFGAAQMGLFISVAPTASAADSQTPQTLSVPADSPRWELQGQARAAEYQGRKCIFLDGGAATLKEFEMRDGVIDVDAEEPASRGFFGIVNPENDAVYLPLKKGSNELLLAVSELGGGWGFICRLADMETEACRTGRI
jgi:hypothetical protein